MSALTKQQLQHLQRAYTESFRVWEVFNAQEEPPKQLMFELSGSVAMLRSILARESFSTQPQNKTYAHKST